MSGVSRVGTLSAESTSQLTAQEAATNDCYRLGRLHCPIQPEEVIHLLHTQTDKQLCNNLQQPYTTLTTTTTTTVLRLCRFCLEVPGWASTRKVKPKPIWISGSKGQWYQLGHMQICTSPQTGNDASIPLQLQLQPFHGSLDFVRTTWVSWYQKKHSPTHTYSGHQSFLICFLHLLRVAITIHGIFPVQFICLLVFFHYLSPSFLWSTSWPDILHFILHTFLHPITVFFSQHMPVPSQPLLTCQVSLPCNIRINQPRTHVSEQRASRYDVCTGVGNDREILRFTT